MTIKPPGLQANAAAAATLASINRRRAASHIVSTAAIVIGISMLNMSHCVLNNGLVAMDNAAAPAGSAPTSDLSRANKVMIATLAQARVQRWQTINTNCVDGAAFISNASSVGSALMR
ncbi:MAG: hypothetical protein AB7E74_14365 [Pirellulales bacterium]